MGWLYLLFPRKVTITKLDSPPPAGQSLARAIQSERDKLKNKVASLEADLTKEKAF